MSCALTSSVDLDALGRIGTALADQTRRQLLVRLLDGPGYPAELAEQFGLTKAIGSNHLPCLRGCGLVSTTPEGRRSATSSPIAASRWRSRNWSSSPSLLLRAASATQGTAHGSPIDARRRCRG